MERDKKLEYLKLILKSNGIKWTGKYYTKDKRELVAAKTFDEVACHSKKSGLVEIEIKDDIWNSYMLGVNEKTLEVIRYDIDAGCVINVTPVFKLGRAWEKAFKNATSVNLD